MIHISELSKSFGDLRVLDALSCEISSGRITGLAGPNACGKTTLIKSILGLVVPDSGTITVEGIPLDSVSYRSCLGYMPQLAEFPRNLKPSELFKLLSALRRKPPARLNELVARFALEPFFDKPFAKLSVGTRQKFSAVAAFSFEPRVLILDEPTAGFDPIACVTFKKLLREAVASGVTALIVSHVMTELEQLVDDLIFLLGGKVLFSGPTATLSETTSTRSLEDGIIRLLNSKNSRPLE